jgi:hypothetical protein
MVVFSGTALPVCLFPAAGALRSQIKGRQILLVETIYIATSTVPLQIP